MNRPAVMLTYSCPCCTRPVGDHNRNEWGRCADWIFRVIAEKKVK